eukprot:2346016-Pyramimonas_sp.AAC.1
MKNGDEKWCTTCKVWATRVEGHDASRHGSGRDADAAPDGGETKRIRTMCCAKCSHVKAKQKSRSGNAKWNESVGTVRCASE